MSSQAGLAFGGPGANPGRYDDEGNVTTLHRPRTCIGCIHFDTGEADMEISPRCTLAAEPLDEVTVAATCPDYEPF